MLISTKTFRNFPCAHRRWRHRGHCALVHGYSRSFTIWFIADELDENGFVMDFGALKPIKAWLEREYDHTLLLDQDDPLLEDFRALSRKGAARVVAYDDVGMEGTARRIFYHVSAWLEHETSGRVSVLAVESRENDKNSAIYVNEKYPNFLVR